jgi:hypothetical protein
MSLPMASFAIAILALLVSIVTFMIGNDENKTLRYGLGALFLLGAILFGLIGLFSSVGAQTRGTNPSIDESNNQLFTDESSQQSSMTEPKLVDSEFTGAEKVVLYNKSLNKNDIIVGSGWGFNSTTGGCVAFLIIGPGQFQFSVTDGQLEQYTSVGSSEQIDLLLNRQTGILQNDYQCSNSSIQVVRLP